MDADEQHVLGAQYGQAVGQPPGLTEDMVDDDIVAHLAMAAIERWKPLLVRRRAVSRSSGARGRFVRIALKPSTARWEKTPSSRMPSSSRAMLDFPELDVPLRKMIRPVAIRT